MASHPGVIRFLLWNWYTTSTTTLEASSTADNDHLVASTQNPSRNVTWRSTGKAGEWITVDLGTAGHFMDALAVVYPRVPLPSIQTLSTPSDLSVPSSTALIRARIANNVAMTTPLYDSGTVSVWESVLSATELDQGQNNEFFNENGNPNDTTKQYLSGQVKVFILPTGVTGRYVRFDFSDPDNTKNYIDISYAYVGRYLEPSPDLLYGWKITKSDPARTPKSSGGTMWPARIFQRTKLSLTLAPQTEASITAYWALINTLVGTRSPIIVQTLDVPSSFKFFTTIYGRIVSNGKFTAVAFKSYNYPIEIEEIIA